MDCIELCNGDLTIWELEVIGMEIEIEGNIGNIGHVSVSKYLQKEDAIKIIQHLKQQFDL